jgi:hypothetical protein
VNSHQLRPGAVRSAVLLAAALLTGCGGVAASATSVALPTSGPVTEAQATRYAHAVNLRAGDLPGFTGTGGETEGPEPGRYDLQYRRCLGGTDLARRIAAITSPEFSAGRAFHAKIVTSTVEVWPTPAIVALNNARSHSHRGQACLIRFLDAVHTKIDRERKGRMQIGPFTLAITPDPLPGVSNSFLTTIDETRLLRTGAIRAHIYRDILQFTTGPAEIELEAIGFGHPIPVPTEKQALRLLLGRATARG